jgi:phosphatidate cytidylyltransferase
MIFQTLKCLTNTPEQIELLSGFRTSLLIRIPALAVALWSYMNSTKNVFIGSSFLAMILTILARMIKFVRTPTKETNKDNLQKMYALTVLQIFADVFFQQFYAIPFIYMFEMYNYRHAYAFALFWLMNCFASDAGGLVFGRKFGKTKFCTKISPNKTWEGVIGSIVAALLFAITYGLLGSLTQYTFIPLIPLKEMIILSLISSLVCVLGDLVESLIKRAADMKDSGTFFPGHGGMLDRLDSLLFSSPLYFFYINCVLIDFYYKPFD